MNDKESRKHTDAHAKKSLQLKKPKHNKLWAKGFLWQFKVLLCKKAGK